MERTVIRRGLIYDGTGRDPYTADIAIQDGYIQEIGSGLSGSRTVHAEGLAVMPGIIDNHTHTDRTIFEAPLSPSKLMQGVTTEVTCNCGIGPFPVSDSHRSDLQEYMDAQATVASSARLDWHGFREYADAVDAVRPGVNLVPLTAHGALRIAVMGFSDRKAGPAEMNAMKQLLDGTLAEGSWGMSTGLVYPPGSFADTEELTGLARVIAGHGAVFTSHVRGESENLLTADQEIIGIAETTGCEVLISHIKAIGKAYWGNAVKALHMIEKAREEGYQVWADQYPYEATSTKLSVLTPDWAQEGGYGALTERLRSASLRETLLEGIRKRMDIRGGPSCVRISTLKTGPNTRWIGHTVAELAADRNVSGEEAVRELLAEEQASVRAVYFSLGKEDLETIIQSPIVAVCSDAPGVDPDVYGSQNVHPRAYGSHARVLGKYVREKKLLSLQTAVWKMTGLPAKIFHIPRRGRLEPGFAADLSVFDPSRIRDRATYEKPHQYAEGVMNVWVNGVLSVKDGRLTGAAGGKVLRKKNSSPHEDA